MSQPSPLTLPILTVAPHRLLFFVGAFNVLAMMLWWTLWLAAEQGLVPALPAPSIPAGWAHALMMPLQVLAPFMFGFLLTVFPRWMNQAAFTPWHYLPVGLGIFGGQVLMLVGLFGHPLLIHLGTVFSLAGWISCMVFLAGVIWRDGGRCLHAVSAFAALCLGLAAWLLFAAWLHLPGQPLWAFAAIKIAVFGFALPVYLTVCHRMLPFFAGAVIQGYRAWRPLPWLAAFWLLRPRELAPWGLVASATAWATASKASSGHRCWYGSPFIGTTLRTNARVPSTVNVSVRSFAGGSLQAAPA